MLIKAFFKPTSKGRCVILRFRVVSAEPLAEFLFEHPSPNAVGSICTVVINFDGAKQRSAWFRLRLFICGLFGVAPNTVTDDELTSTVEDLLREKDVSPKDANPVRGMLIRLGLHPGRAKFNWACVAPPGDGENDVTVARARFQALAATGDLTSESSVEKALFLALLARGVLTCHDGGVAISGPNWLVIPQYEELTYRIDFALLAGAARIAIETDGHDFHERTEEQAQYDKKRDRDLQAAGWRVLRYTAAEVVHDVEGCLADAFRLLP